ncbi:4'-phosphopantetheinyl transferase family protein [Dictyobacter arantiisoli]|uniref:4'-phosphopantetheinyl transferase n=1 Tax=Dictyobacter arantiisoli TaxID=2014874 RepID=A0A5A5TEN3_9CHLR|nr:4'-phosphopantetheinyl transferase superfamily protein [Dictyobacter arantiisoli]GCF09469.1 4'-phosphopantetheinyl transferase [Dictyobacter arantiisoli]
MAIWQEAPENFTLTRQEIHVWGTYFDAWLSDISRLTSVLSDDERERASRFHFEKDRQRSIIARGLLRILLGKYCSCPPRDIIFTYNDYGKPALSESERYPLVYFNLAHSYNMVAYAFTLMNPVGIDVEYMRTNIEYEQLAQHYFSPDENEQLNSLSGEQKAQAFFAGWTRKEAYIKARGKGLSIPLTSFDVTLRPDLPAQLLACREIPSVAQNWSLTALPVEPPYAGALALEGTADKIRYWQVPASLVS